MLSEKIIGRRFLSDLKRKLDIIIYILIADLYELHRASFYFINFLKNNLTF